MGATHPDPSSCGMNDPTPNAPRSLLPVLYPRRPKRCGSGSGQEFQDMAVRVPEVDASPSTAGVDLPILKGTRAASVRDASGLDPAKDRVKFCIAHVKRVVVALKPIAGVEVQRQSVVHPYG